MPIYLVFQFVGIEEHVFDVILTTSKPPHHEAIYSSFIELSDSSLGQYFELDEFDRQCICKVYYPVILTIVTLSVSKAKTKIVYQIHLPLFYEIIKNTIAQYVPFITEEMLFSKLLLMVDKKKTKPEVLEYLEKLEYQIEDEQELAVV